MLIIRLIFSGHAWTRRKELNMIKHNFAVRELRNLFSLLHALFYIMVTFPFVCSTVTL